MGIAWREIGVLDYPFSESPGFGGNCVALRGDVRLSGHKVLKTIRTSFRQIALLLEVIFYSCHGESNGCKTQTECSYIAGVFIYL
jgi:hypothetical protein